MNAKGLYPIGTEFSESCETFPGNKVIVYHSGKTSFFSVSINDVKKLDEINARTNHPVNRFSKDPLNPPVYITFQQFYVNGKMWAFKADVDTTLNGSRTKDRFHEYESIPKDSFGIISNKKIADEYLNKALQRASR